MQPLHIIFTWVLLGGLSSLTHAQGFGELHSGGRMAALGSAYAAVSGDIWTQFANPAGLARLEQTALGVNGTQLAGLSTLNQGQIAFGWALPGDQAAGVYVHRMGWEVWGETRAGLSYGVEVLGRLRLGARAELSQIALAGYGSNSLFQGSAGMQLDINQELTLGVAVRNFTQTSIVDLNGNQARTIATSTAGISYRPTQKVLFTGEAAIQSNFPVYWRGGLEYQVGDILFLRLGGMFGNGYGTTLSGGLGLNWKSLEMDFAIQRGSLFGTSPTLSLAYAFGQVPED